MREYRADAPGTLTAIEGVIEGTLTYAPGWYEPPLLLASARGQQVIVDLLMKAIVTRDTLRAKAGLTTGVAAAKVAVKPSTSTPAAAAATPAPPSTSTPTVADEKKSSVATCIALTDAFRHANSHQLRDLIDELITHAPSSLIDRLMHRATVNGAHRVVPAASASAPNRFASVLPHELITMMGHLDTTTLVTVVTRVCRQWKHVVLDNGLIPHLARVSHPNGCIKSKLSGVTLTDAWLLTHRHALQRVSYAHVNDGLTDVGMRALLQLPQLHTLLWDTRGDDAVSPNQLFDSLQLRVSDIIAPYGDLLLIC